MIPTSVRLAPDVVARLDRLVKAVGEDGEFVMVHGTPSRHRMIQMAVVRGLRQMEEEHKEGER